MSCVNGFEEEVRLTRPDDPGMMLKMKQEEKDTKINLRGREVLKLLEEQNSAPRPDREAVVDREVTTHQIAGWDRLSAN